jgi:hypothetical protein
VYPDRQFWVNTFFEFGLKFETPNAGDRLPTGGEEPPKSLCGRMMATWHPLSEFAQMSKRPPSLGRTF